MKQYCLLTGIDLSPDGATNGFKKMCLNCKDCEAQLDDKFVCYNKNVLDMGKKKILENLPEGYEIEELKLKPMNLKDPTKRCTNHEFDTAKVMDYVVDYFGLKPQRVDAVENEQPAE